MVDVDKFTDAELRTKLLEFGFPVMPITGTTRKVMAKKLKLLMENKNKLGSDTGRKSLGRYSSEEDSDSDAKQARKEKNRRATMAAPMQPPQSRTRKSTRLNDTPEPEIALSPVKRDTRNTTTTTTTRTQRIIKTAQDEFDTGSDSESDIVAKPYSFPANDVEYKRGSPIRSSYVSPARFTPPETSESSYSSTRNVTFNSNPSPGRLTTFSSPSNASEYASDRLNQIRSRLSLGSSGYDRPLSYTSPPVAEKIEKEETPFLSNFTRRLTQLSQKQYDRDDEVKEHDANGSSAYTRGYLNSYRAARGRDATYDYRNNQSGILKNNFVSFAVLAGAALFFVFLAILYLGMRSDTAVVSSGFVIPRCVTHDPQTKLGVNCVREDAVSTALHLLNVLSPELRKKSVAHKCFDPTIKPQMTESEIITFCKTNFGIRDERQINQDLVNLEILTFLNADWGINVTLTENNNGPVHEEDAAKNMEQVIFNKDKSVISLVIFNPDLPWKCTIYKTFSMVFSSLLFVTAVFLALYLSNLAFKYYKLYEQKRKDEIGFLVEKIIDILQSNIAEDGGENFVVINHVRDMILPVADRKRKEKNWAQAVKYINENESRVRTEIQTVQGEPFEVWRWIGAANLSKSGSPRNKTWQGQAFETQSGSPNSLPCSPTPCLKIRGMVEEGDRNTHMIKEAVLSKCAHQCKILHCAVDTNSNCVYLKCADPSDAAVAYRNLHGWWYSGHLVTVKYLRLERYMQRFPDSPANGPPFLKAITPSID